MSWTRHIPPLTHARGASARILLLALGLAVFAGLSWQIGPDEILAHLRPLGWTVALALPPYFLVFLLDAGGWRYAFDRAIPVSLSGLTMIQIIGKAVNLVTPLAPIGGEPLKAYLLHARGVPLAEGFASVVVSRTLVTIAHGLFVVGVTAFTLAYLDLPAVLLKAVLGAVLAGVVLVGAFILLQTRGLFGGLLGILRRLGLGLVSLEDGARDLDRRIAGYYRHHRARASAALALNVLGWLAEGLEVYVILALLGLPRSPALALAVTAFSSTVRAASFVVPASLGVQEGGNVLIFASFGLPPDAAMAFSILRRFREAAWAAAGFSLLSWSGLDRRLPLGAPSATVREPRTAS